MSWLDEICLSCGVCCTTLSIVHITQADLDRLVRGYNLSAEQGEALVRREPLAGRHCASGAAACPNQPGSPVNRLPGEGSQLRILMDNHAACGALSARGGRYACQAYEHRPGICREYECFILLGVKAWLAKRAAGEVVDEGNPFHTAGDEDELRRQVESAVQRMRSDNLSDCLQLQNGARGRPYERLPELIATLSGAEFDHTFPPG